MGPTDAELAIAAAEAGTDIVRSMYGESVERFAKTDADFATTADIDAEKAIIEVIRSARPEDAILGEESGAHGIDERTWLVDPLCGTANFAARTPLVAINVALRRGADLVAAASADPVGGEMFWTDGEGAWVRRSGADVALVPSSESRLVEVNLDPPFPNHDVFRGTRLLADPLFNEKFSPRVVSTTLAVAWVAAGRRAAYVTDRDMRGNVHFAAGIALCQAAGCTVTGLRGQPVFDGVAGLVVAADPATHSALLSLI